MSYQDVLNYQGSHRPAGKDHGAPLHDLTRVYPDDVYGSRAAQYYGHYGNNHQSDRESFETAKRYRNQPDKLIRIHRAVSKDEHKATEINPGDWVTISHRYAKEHGEGPLKGDYKILSKVVPAKHIYTSGDSIHEWGYHPDEKHE